MRNWIDAWDLKVGLTAISAAVINKVDVDSALQILALCGTIIYTGFSIYEKSQMIRRNRKKKDDE